MVKRNQLVEIGRVVSINRGCNAGKIAVVIDLVDQARALIDGPANITGVKRQTIPFSWLSLTAIKVPITRGARQSTLTKVFEDKKVMDAWNKTSWSKKLARQKLRASLSDFQRFQVMILRKKKSSIINREVAALKRASKGGKAPAKSAKKK